MGITLSSLNQLSCSLTLVSYIINPHPPPFHTMEHDNCLLYSSAVLNLATAIVVQLTKKGKIALHAVQTRGEYWLWVVVFFFQFIQAQGLTFMFSM